MNKHYGIIAGCCAAFGTVVHGGIVATTGSAAVVPIPANVAGDVYESDTVIAVFVERQNVSLASNVSVDATQPGDYDALADLTPGFIAAGTTVSSYLIHWDRLGQNNGFLYRSGSVTFDQPVLGLMSSRSTLISGDGVLGAPGTTYGTGDNLGIDFNTGDAYTLTGDRRTVNFFLGTNPGEDHLRIVTAVPEPAGLLLAGLGGATLLNRRRPR
ncbi:MAG TPA: PEP-CTERM sorting domain-containing protein [Tepidisphaeraceae bacterium]|jgi:hypothetical protein